MRAAMIVPLLFGLIGAGVLIWLGLWQIDRLGQKQAQLAEIENSVHADPVEFSTLSPQMLIKYTPVRIKGTTTGQDVHVLVSRKNVGAGYRVISGLDIADGRRVLLDRGFVKSEAKNDRREAAEMQITGNLHTPDDRNSSTPQNDETGNIWFARDIQDMARVLEAEPILIVSRADTGQGIDPMPVSVTGIPNDHLQYAITWFSLAIVWLGMTAFLLWRIKRRTA